MSEASSGGSYVKYTSISLYNSQAFVLVKEGFGSLSEINKLDSNDFIDALEYIEIQGKIMAHTTKQGERK